MNIHKYIYLCIRKSIYSLKRNWRSCRHMMIYHDMRTKNGSQNTENLNLPKALNPKRHYPVNAAGGHEINNLKTDWRIQQMDIHNQTYVHMYENLRTHGHRPIYGGLNRPLEVTIHDAGNRVEECSFTWTREDGVESFLHYLLNNRVFPHCFSANHVAYSKWGEPFLGSFLQKHSGDT